MICRVVALAAIVVGGCAVRPPETPRWDGYADKGPFPVRTAPASAPGPTLLRALQREGLVRRALAVEDQPETVEIVTGQGAAKRIVLTYGRRRDRPARRVVLAPPNGEPMSDPPSAPPRAPARHVARAATPREEPPRPTAAGGTPTIAQRLECPIDPDRADCRALCAGSGLYEWCR